MSEFEYERGAFYTYVVRSVFTDGQMDMRFNVGDEFEYDGTIMRIGNEETTSQRIRGAIKHGWAARLGSPKTQLQAPRANIKISAALPENRERGMVEMSVERFEDERVVGTLDGIRAAAKNPGLSSIGRDRQAAPATRTASELTFVGDSVNAPVFRGERVVATISAPLKTSFNTETGKTLDLNTGREVQSADENRKQNSGFSEAETAGLNRDTAPGRQVQHTGRDTRPAVKTSVPTKAQPTAPTELEWDLSANPMKRIGDMRKQFANRPDVLLQLYNIETPKIKAMMVDKFPGVSFPK
jgi:hypothetical protein